ncbi:MAG TPA: serine/threonine-protein kinase PknK, partial [Candidatus Polarisedimenticolia bacterium]|nr:serine/threonine-protein kinase PknK [Candidatus Polarisedimenticolia bacterium]
MIPAGLELDQVLWDEGDFRYCRIRRRSADGTSTCLAVVPTAEHPAPGTLHRLAHEHALKDDLDGAWAVRPLELVRERGQTALLLEDHEGVPLDRLVQGPMEIGGCLRIAVALTAAIVPLHERGLVHKDIKPVNILVDPSRDRVRLMGFGIASRLPREHQPPAPPELIAGTLSHMAPEQTGRMNRAIDSRSDLYALGVTLYETLTGTLPFMATDPLEWVHCHIARTPVAPDVRVPGVPSQVSAIVMRLLAKTPEDRYQTAAAVERDLKRCLADWEEKQVVDEFVLGENDRPGRLTIAGRLYGRAPQIEALLAAFDGIVAAGTPALVLVSGPAGIGKSSIVNEVHQRLVPPHGLFAAGKFDRLQRDIPYGTLARAVRDLVRRLLGEPDAELGRWRESLRQALDPNGALVIDLIPELKFILGDQPAVLELAPADAKIRFHRTLRRLIGVFARPEHPLALFLDDLQWLDAATLDLLEDVLVQRDRHPLLLIGAYRDTEVDAAHPLARRLSSLRERGAALQEIALAPLDEKDLVRWLAETVHCDPSRATPLAALVHQKTGGNPFFVQQFIQELVEDGGIAFDPREAEWRWDLERLRARTRTDNVVDLLIRRLSRLPAKTREALKDLACLGSQAETSLLAAVRRTSEEQILLDLWEPRRLELVVLDQGTCRFSHDRIQEAAYALIPEDQRAQAHLRIGRLLAAHRDIDDRDERIFEIVGQLNRGSNLMPPDERERLAGLNLAAGKRARAATAYATTLNSVAVGLALAPGDGWERRHDLLFELEILRAECEFLTGEMTLAETHLRALSSRAADVVERAAIAGALVDVNWGLQRPDRGLAECLACLHDAGLDLPARPTTAQARGAYDRVRSKLHGLRIDELAERPLMTDPVSKALLDVLAKAMPCAVTTDRNLVTLIVCAAVEISLERGQCDSSCFAYEYLGFIAGWNFGDFEAALRFGRLGHDLVERRGLRRFEGIVNLIFSATIMPWTSPIAGSRGLLRATIDVADRAGDRLSAVCCWGELVSHGLLAGDPLDEAEKDAEAGLEFCRKAGFSDFVDRIGLQAAFIRNLRGRTHPFGSLQDERFDERRMQEGFATGHHLAAWEFWYWIRLLQARFLAGDIAAALEASER